MPRSVGLLVVVIAGVGLAGCFTTAADFKSDAEKFIVEDADLTAALFPDGDGGFDSATCEEPESQDVGTTFTCNAVDDNGADWEFEVVIQESNKYEINVSRFPADP